jgi:hypothetical protein
LPVGMNRFKSMKSAKLGRIWAKVKNTPGSAALQSGQTRAFLIIVLSPAVGSA